MVAAERAEAKKKSPAWQNEKHTKKEMEAN